MLVIGAGGGVGTFAVQVAAHLGARVTAVTSAAKVDLVRTLGATEVVDYGRDEVGGEFDVILDIGGRRPLGELRDLLVPGGTVAFIGGEGGGPLTGGLHRNLLGAVRGRLGGRRFFTLFATSDGKNLDELADLLGSGRIRSVVAGTYPLERSADALRAFEGGPAGKIAIVL